MLENLGAPGFDMGGGGDVRPPGARQNAGLHILRNREAKGGEVEVFKGGWGGAVGGEQGSGKERWGKMRGDRGHVRQWIARGEDCGTA